MGGRQLTNAHNHKGSHSIEDAQVLDAKNHMVEEECHQAAEADAGNPEEGQEHWAGGGAEGSREGPHRTQTPSVTLTSAPHPGPLHHPVCSQPGVGTICRI